MAKNAAWVSLLSKIEYLPGLLVVNHGLKSVKSRYPLVVMVTATLPAVARAVLRGRGLRVIEIDMIEPGRSHECFDKADGRFADTWSKLRTFELVDYERVVLLDADMVIRRNMDELMEMELGANEIAASHVCACNPRNRPHYPPDWIPANCPHSAVLTPLSPPPSTWSEGCPRPYAELNSGLVVLNPSLAVASAILARLSTTATCKYYFPDQGLLADHFHGRWRALPWYYNALRTLRVVHPRMWDDEEVRCIHYILADKPWMERIPEGGTGGPFDVVNKWWWEDFKSLGEQMVEEDVEAWRVLERNVAPEVV